MNPFFVTIQPCEIARGDSDIISADEFVKSVELQTMESQVRERIQSALKDAHMQREQLRQQAEQYLVDAQNEAQQLMVQWEQEAKSQAINGAVAWIQDELQFRHDLLEELRAGVAKQIQSVVVNWAGEFEKADLIVAKLTEEVLEKLGEGAITLLVAEDDYESLTTKLGEEFKIKVEPSFEAGVAELQSAALSARIDLNQHLELLLEAFVIQKVGSVKVADQPAESAGVDEANEFYEPETEMAEELYEADSGLETSEFDSEFEENMFESDIGTEIETDDPDYEEAY